MLFIIGGKGFVGSAFERICASQQREFVVIDRQNYHKYIGKHCDILINANGNSKKFLSTQAPLKDFEASVRSVRASLIDFKYDLYVYLSSCDVYENCSSPETTSENITLDISRQSPYGFHKYLAEQCVQHVAPNWLIMRLGGFIGPGLKKNAIFDILKGGPLWLDPQSELQFISTDRAAEIVLSLTSFRAQNEIYNLCGQGVISLQEVMKWIKHPVSVQPGSPRVRYEVNSHKISQLALLPDTRTSVREFINTSLKADSTTQ